MANFRAVIRGQRGEASRLGSKQSGMVAHVDGWNTGVTVRIDHIDGRDRVTIIRTGGSNAHTIGAHVVQWFDGEPTQVATELRNELSAK